MERIAAKTGPPGCWGFYRDDDDCPACAFRKSCRRSFRRMQSAATVASAAAEAFAASQPAPDPEADSNSPRSLVRYGHSLFMKHGGKGHVHTWGAKYECAMQAVATACAIAGWDPRMYVRAQIECLIPNILRGWPIYAAMFTGPKADDRFARWVDRQRRLFGRRHIDTAAHHALVAARAAAFSYASGRVSGVGHAAAVLLAQQHVPGWKRIDMPEHMRPLALSSALAEIDPVLPQMIMPAGRWTWKQAEELGRRLREQTHVHRGGPTGRLNPALGELL